MAYMHVNCRVRGTCNKKGLGGTCSKSGKHPAAGIWWFHFTFGAGMIHESSRSSSKTVTLEAKKQRRRQLEETRNGIKKSGPCRPLSRKLPRSGCKGRRGALQ